MVLSFHSGAELKDPKHVLQGTGKLMRHIRVSNATDLKRAEIREFLRRARKHAGLKPADRTAANGVVTRVKRKSAARRSDLPPTAW